MSENIQMITLLTVIGNLILNPILQYMLHSRCDKIKCCGCLDIHRIVDTETGTNDTV